jgi:hypothetical protein
MRAINKIGDPPKQLIAAWAFGGRRACQNNGVDSAGGRVAPSLGAEISRHGWIIWLETIRCAAFVESGHRTKSQLQ